MTYDRRRSCSAPDETTGLAGPRARPSSAALRPLSRALPRRHLPRAACVAHSSTLVCVCVCVYARVVGTCVSTALTEAMHARHGAPSTHHGSGGGGAPRAQDSAQPSSDCRCSAAARTCAQYSVQPSSDCRCSAAASTRTRRCTSSTGNLVFAIRAGSSCSNQRSCWSAEGAAGNPTASAASPEGASTSAARPRQRLNSVGLSAMAYPTKTPLSPSDGAERPIASKSCMPTFGGTQRGEGERQSEATTAERQSDAIRRNRTQSDAIGRNQTQSDAIRRNQTQSDAIRRNQTQSPAASE
jgi:hypothetical protein